MCRLFVFVNVFFECVCVCVCVCSVSLTIGAPFVESVAIELNDSTK